MKAQHAKAKGHMKKAEMHAEKAAKHSEMAHKAMLGSAKQEVKMAKKGNKK